MSNKDAKKETLSPKELEEVTGGFGVDLGPMRDRWDKVGATITAIKENNTSVAISKTNALLGMSSGISTLLGMMEKSNVPHNEAYNAVMNIINNSKK